MTEISCDRCIAPGTCCKAFPLSYQIELGTSIESLQSSLDRDGFPFKPLRRVEVYAASGDHKGNGHKWWERWYFTCTKVGDDGRCTIYEDRPELCRKYEPGVDAMCVHMRMPDGEPLLPQLPVLNPMP